MALAISFASTVSATEVSTVRQIDPREPIVAPRSVGGSVWASIDGSGNNLAQPQMGAAHTPLRRQLPSAYADDQQAMTGQTRRSARELSNQLNTQPPASPQLTTVSDFLWQWGQFLDHDLDLTDGTDPPEPAAIAVPLGDPQFDPQANGNEQIAFNRSLYTTDSQGRRQQVNEITTWIDGSQVYGSDAARAAALRRNDGSGKLLLDQNGLLPLNLAGLPNATGGRDPQALFLAGDVRANEQVGLTVMHTLFVREHNRLVDAYTAAQPELDGETLYQLARRWVIGQLQVISYDEYLPVLLGADALGTYSGYQPSVDASIANVFATAAYRYGHSALNDQLLRLDDRNRSVVDGSLSLRDAFFAPSQVEQYGIEPFLRGLAWQRCRPIDLMVSEDVRSFLFGPPGAGGFDLAALNIQRGRDHGLPDYNTVREAMGLPRAVDFADITDDQNLAARLQVAYASIDDMDAWVGGLAEDPVPGALVGPTFHAILVDQFQRLRDGDRFWYQNQFSPVEIAQLQRTRLADIIRRNTTVGTELFDNVFQVPVLFASDFED